MSWLRKITNKNTDIVLVMCPGWGIKQPPAGISYLKSYLENKGIKTKCLDLSVEFYQVFPHKHYWNLNYPEHFIEPALFENQILPFVAPHIDVWAKKILSINPQAVGFSLFMSSSNVGKLLATHIKQLNPDIVTIAGGAETSRIKRLVRNYNKQIEKAEMPEASLFEILDAFDLIVYDEGEETLFEIASLLKQNKDIVDVKGTIGFQGKELIINEPRRLIADLDCLSPADFSDFELGKYTEKVLPIVSSRGCVNRCTFCADSPLWKTYRYLSAEKVVHEMKQLNKKYRYRNFEFIDSSFNGNMSRMEKICDLLIKSKLGVSWSAKVRVEKGMTLNLLQKMKNAGCDNLSYGIESGSPRVLKSMRKNLDLKIAEQVIKDTQKANINANCFFLIGYPTETEDDFCATLDFITDNASAIYRFDQVTSCHIDEDSYLAQHPDEFGIVLKPDGWYCHDNTPQVRRERMGRFRDLARTLHQHYSCEVQY